MKTIEERFNADFAAWGIHLPSEDITNRRRGKIVKAGWSIWYLFGLNEKGEYLDYYAAHRMTNDRHIRIYLNGQEEFLPVIQGFRLGSQDPEEDKRLDAEHVAANQRIAELLEEKGFGIVGDEPGGVQINRALHLKKFEK